MSRRRDELDNEPPFNPWQNYVARAVEIIALDPSGLDRGRDELVTEILRLAKRLYVESAKLQRMADQAIENEK